MRMIRCYAEGRPGRWEAFCLDFDLAVQGESFAEVFDDLDKAVAEYVAHVATLPEPDRSRLLARRAPLGMRLAFVWHALLAAVRPSSGRDGEATRAEFLLPAPA